MRVEKHIRELAQLHGATNISDAEVKGIKRALDGEYLDSILDGRAPFSDKSGGCGKPHTKKKKDESKKDEKKD